MLPPPESTLRKIYRKLTPDFISARPPKPEKLFFVHIQKCGGMSIDAALQRAYTASGAHVVRLNAVALEVASKALKKNRDAHRNWLLGYYMAGEADYISGHFHFDEAAHKAFGETWHYATVLRDPVARWLSNYFYNKYKTHSQHFRTDLPIEEFLEARQGRNFGSNYVRCLTTVARGEELASEEVVEQAIRNLDLFSVVGVLEDLGTFAADCEQRFGLRLGIEHRNANPRSGKQQREELSDEILERIRELCEPNFRVYDAVRARLAERGTWLGTEPMERKRPRG